jgi:phosphonate transport system substrate-binding protein
MQTKQQPMLLAFALVVTLALAACGGATPARPTTAPAPTAAPAAEPTAAPATSGVDKTGWPSKFVVGIFGGDDAEKALEDNDPLRVYLEQRLEMPVELFTGTSYSAVIEAMRADRVDGMLVGPFAYVLAVQEAQAEALAVFTGESGDIKGYNPDVPSHYYSAIITKKGSGIISTADLKGRTFAFVDAASTSGHLAPKTLLLKEGLNPDVDMQVTFAGSHPTAVLAVWNGSTEAGATFEGNLYTLQEEGQIEFCGFEDGIVGKTRTPAEIKAVYDACPDGNIAIISMSDEIPSTPFAVRTELPESFKTTVKTALLEVKDQPELVAALGSWYLDPTEDLGLDRLDAYYNSLRDIAKLLDLDLKELAR